MASNGDGDSFPANVTILQYLLENDSATSTSKTTGVGSCGAKGVASDKAADRMEGATAKKDQEPIPVYDCPEAGCDKHYLQLEHLKAHEKIHSGDLVCNWESHPEEELEQPGGSGLKFLLQNEDLELVYEESNDDDDDIVEDAQIIDDNSVGSHKSRYDEDELDDYQSDSNLSEDDVEIVDFDLHQQKRFETNSKRVVHVFDADVNLEENFVVLEEDPDEYVQIDLNLDQPMRTTSTKARRYVCKWEGCSRAYTKSSHVTAHMRVHTGELPFVCNWKGCEGRFARAETLTRHFRKHSGERNFACPECSATFGRSDHLRGHMKRHNIDSFVIEKVIKSPERSKPPTSSKLSAIASKHASKSKRKRKPSTPASGLARSYSCKYPDCDKSYTRSSHLKAHEILHGKSLPFRCPWEDCNRSFARSFELSRHRRQHTGEKKFVCHICQQAFMRSDHLSMHVKRHVFRAVKDDL